MLCITFPTLLLNALNECLSISSSGGLFSFCVVHMLLNCVCVCACVCSVSFHFMFFFLVSFNSAFNVDLPLVFLDHSKFWAHINTLEVGLQRTIYPKMPYSMTVVVIIIFFLFIPILFTLFVFLLFNSCLFTSSICWYFTISPFEINFSNCIRNCHKSLWIFCFSSVYYRFLRV